MDKIQIQKDVSHLKRLDLMLKMVIYKHKTTKISIDNNLMKVDLKIVLLLISHVSQITLENMMKLALSKRENIIKMVIILRPKVNLKYYTQTKVQVSKLILKINQILLIPDNQWQNLVQ